MFLTKLGILPAMGRLEIAVVPWISLVAACVISALSLAEKGANRDLVVGLLGFVGSVLLFFEGEDLR